MRLPVFLILLGAFTATAHDSEVQLPFERAHTHESVEGHLHTGWESRYFSEGRDSLDRDSLWTNSFELGWNHLSGGIWYGDSPEQDYDELQLTFALTENIADFEFYIAYTHLRFPFDGSHDNEIGMGSSWSGLPWKLEVGADAYYSFDAEGSFWELILSREVVISNGLKLDVSGIFGVNQGYVPDGHDGANHLALRTGAELAITESFAITAHATYSWELERDPNSPGDDQLIDFFHGGIGVQWSF